MASVARETNLSDTAFVIREEVPGADFRLRWFTPTVEIDLCGHATLASAHCLFEEGEEGPIRFATRSGVLTVDRRPDGSLAMDFPAWPATPFEARDAVAEAIGAPVVWTGRTDNESFLLALLADESSVRDLDPDLARIHRRSGCCRSERVDVAADGSARVEVAGRVPAGLHVAVPVGSCRTSGRVSGR